MEKIASFTINHLDLLRGIYVSRIDYVSDNPITTYDIRMKQPNVEPVMNTAEIHTIEHLGATFLRNHPVKRDEVIYFGPMGCRTGFYLLLKGNASSREILPLVEEMFAFIAQFHGEVPGATARDCGNYFDINLPMARFEARKYLSEILTVIKEENLVYPTT
ncbi:MAG: S-ribosylhomocysteinase [Epulopiscium sp. Nele67-Bin002]|nr:MAG: S-ribosylhomocysteine lyase [Epulopiscium sp. Nuni2H_MBin001]OON91262.1 MAG: S-ribosylhomocysteinase [Epulopiscium sp. Nele67-Bin002]